ncbi:MAG: caspase family protein [Rhodospirillaceae bacterium]
MPQGGAVVSGSATITRSGNQLKVVQTTPKAAINWQSYSIATNEQVSYYQPSTQSIILNRVLGGGVSTIDGRLTANGQVWISNPSGIFFGPNARVNVGGLIATTHDLKVEDFNADRYHFQSDTQPTGIVENEGRISVADAGLAAFVAPGVANHGTITARLGQVTLASGNEFTVDLYGDQKINLAMDAKTAQQVLGRDGMPLDALVKNDGKIFADGGRVQLTAAAAKGLVDTVVSVGGIIEARSVEKVNGEIILGGEGGAVQVVGTLDASGKSAGQTGGTVIATADAVTVKADARIDVSGYAGGGQALIGGDFRGGNASAAEYAEYAIRPSRKPVPPAETTAIEAGATITADALTSGRGGELIVWSTDATSVKGSLSAKGGSQIGAGGFIETSGHWLDINGISASTKAIHGAGGTWLLDPWNVTISATGSTSFSTGGELDPGADTDILASTLSAALNAGNSVVITTGTGGSSAGDITVNAPISWGTPSALTLSAYRNVNLKADVTNSGGGAITLLADTSGLNNGGQVSFLSNSTTRATSGSVFASGDSVFLEKGSAVGGQSVNFSAPTIVGAGSVAAAGTGASVTLSGDYISFAGSISADNPTGIGGSLFLDGGSTVMLSDTSKLSASGASGGSVRITADTGYVLGSGILQATGSSGFGGLIQIAGAGSTTLLGASLDASGALGGGTVHVGGGWHGAGSLPASTSTTVDANSSIAADATQTGPGGEVALWSQSSTSFWGNITARGGISGGNGGRVELSSAGQLDVKTGTGRGVAVNARGAGSNGTIVADPADVVIGDAMQSFDIWRSLLTSTGQLLNTGTSSVSLQPSANFGSAVALNDSYALIGAYGASINRGDAYLYNLRTGAWTDLATTTGQPITALTGGAAYGLAGNSYFGASVALNGSYALIGAWGVSGSRGNAYLYNIGSGTWTDLATTSSQPVTSLAGNSYFGASVALNSSMALIGAEGASAGRGDAYLYNLINGTWTTLSSLSVQPITTLTGPANFGNAVALNGNTALIGAWGVASNRGNAFLYNLSSGTWTDLANTNSPPITTLSGGARFGVDVALNNDTALIGAQGVSTNRGDAYLYNLITGTWIDLAATSGQPITPLSGGSFGGAVALNNRYALIGASGAAAGRGDAYLYNLSNGTWTDLATTSSQPVTGLGVNSYFGTAVALNNSYALIGASGISSSQGEAYLYNLGSGAWTDLVAGRGQPITVLNGGAEFGSASIALSDSFALIGAFGAASSRGNAYLYNLTSGAWTDLATTPAQPITALTSGANFGFSVALNSNNALIGAFGKSSNQGDAYLYDLIGGSWTDLGTTAGQPITAMTNSYFGYSVALNSSYALIGANGAASNHGSAYLYSLTNGAWTDLSSTSGQPISGLSSGAQFGAAVALNNNYALIGAWNVASQQGDAYLYNLTSHAWTDLATTTGQPITSLVNAGVGMAVALNNNYALIGAGIEVGGNYRGNAYLYNLAGGAGAWTDLATTTNSPIPSLSPGSYFGYSVALNNTYALIGASNVLSNRGDAYLYNLAGGSTAWTDLAGTSGQPITGLLANSYFGRSVALNNTSALIGAYGVSNGRGDAYLYNLAGGTGAWTDLATTAGQPITALSNAYFGSSVALNNSFALIGAGGAGGRGDAYLYNLTNGTWTDLATTSAQPITYLLGSNFGFSVALNSSYALIGAYGAGQNSQGDAYLYNLTSGVWTDLASTANYPITALIANSMFGYRVALNSDYALVGALGVASNRGDAYLYNIANGSWTDLATSGSLITGLSSNSQFSSAVALNSTYALIGAWNVASQQGDAYLYNITAHAWTDLATTSGEPITTHPGAGFGIAAALNNNYALIGAYETSGFRGNAYLYNLGNGAWTDLNTTSNSPITALAPGSNFGTSVALNSGYALIGATGASVSPGSAYLYKLVGGANAWTSLDATPGQPITALAIGSQFGNSVALNSNYALIGAPGVGTSRGDAYLYNLNSGAWSDLATTVGPPNQLALNSIFGVSVALNGNYALIGARAVTGDRGTAYLYNLGNSTWLDLAATSNQPISTLPAGAEFGYSVALNSNYALVGALYGGGNTQGDAYLYSLSSGTWTDLASSPGQLISGLPANSKVGNAVALSDSYALIGAPGIPGNGGAYLYNLANGAWTDLASTSGQLVTSSTNFGHSVAINSTYALIGTWQYAAGRGNAYLYNITGGWLDLSSTANQPITSMSSSSGFGYSVSLNSTYALIGASAISNHGGAYLYNLSGGASAWTDLVSTSGAPSLAANAGFGGSVALSSNYALIGAAGVASNQGNAYLYNLGNGTWNDLAATSSQPITALTGSSYFGTSVALNSSYALVSAYGVSSNRGDAYLYNLTSGAWTELASTITPPTTPIAPNSSFGTSVALSSNYALIGAPGALSSRGDAYLYNLTTGLWTDLATTTGQPVTSLASNSVFGNSVALNSAYALIGAAQVSSNRGDAFLYNITSGVWTDLASTSGQPVTALGASSAFGGAVALNNNYALIGAPAAMDAFLYNLGTGAWNDLASTTGQPITALGGGSGFGTSVSLNSTYALIGAAGAYGQRGDAFLYNLGSGAWTGLSATSGEPVSGLAGSSQFGVSVALNEGYALMGAYGALSARGNAYLYSLTSGAWTDLSATVGEPVAALPPSSLFGGRVSLSSNYALIGAYGISSSRGDAYLYNLASGGWTDLVATSSQLTSALSANAQFGNSVALNDNYALIGATNGSNQGNAYLAYLPYVTNSVVTPETIQAGLASGNFTVTADNSLTINDLSLTNLNSSNSLTLQSGGGISVNGPVALGSRTVTFLANAPSAVLGDSTLRSAGPGGITVNANASIDDGSGSLTLQIGTASSTGRSGSTSTAGDFTLSDTVSAGSILVNGSESYLDDPAAIMATTGNVIINGKGENFSGNGTINTPNGYWRIYNTTASSLGSITLTSGMTTSFNRYGCTYSGGCATGGIIPGAGNGVIYAYAPTLSVTPSSQSISYGDGAPSFSPTFAGYVNGDSSPGTITGSASWSISGPQSSDGKYTIGTHNVSYGGGLSSSVGYIFADNSGSGNELVVTQAQPAPSNTTSSSPDSTVATVTTETVVPTPALNTLSTAVTSALQSVNALSQRLSSEEAAGVFGTPIATANLSGTAEGPMPIIGADLGGPEQNGADTPVNGAGPSLALAPGTATEPTNQAGPAMTAQGQAAAAPLVMVASVPVLTTPIAPTLTQLSQAPQVQQGMKTVSTALNTATSGGGSVHDTLVSLNTGSTKLTMQEQKAVFANVPTPKLVSGLLGSSNPVDKAVGGQLQQVAAGNVKTTFADVKSVLTQGGVSGPTAQTYLAMYQVVHKEAMTTLFKGALQELTSNPHAADIQTASADTPARGTRTVGGVTASEGGAVIRATVSTEAFRQITVPSVSTQTDTNGRTIIRGRIANWKPGMDVSALSSKPSIELAALDTSSIDDLIGRAFPDQVAEAPSTKIEGWAGGRQVRINGRWIFVRDDGSFEVALPAGMTSDAVKLTIVDETGEVREQNVAVQAGSASGPARPAQPHKIAVLIANSSYSQNGIPDLNTPANDVARVSEVLHNKLGYVTRVIHNATKADIAAAIDGLHSEAVEGDQVFIYYAGHGYENERTGVGYWLPVDATTSSAKNWVSTKDVARLLRRVPAKNIMLVADSCYSGSFTKEQNYQSVNHNGNLEELGTLRGVMAMSSGGDEPVMDGEVNSPFARALADRMTEIASVTVGEELYTKVKADVTAATPQTPQYGVISSAGYDPGADYLIRQRPAQVSQR